MTKSTQSLKNERKVTINIATEVGSETKTTREISNPNNEITVTYLFYELQRVYKVREPYLHDVIPVVFVANYVPSWAEINDDWVIRHDWILAGAILDKSFIPTLAFVTNELPGLKYARDRAAEAYAEALSVVEAIKAQIREKEADLAAATDKLKAANSLGEFVQAVSEIRQARQQIQQLQPQLPPAQGALKEAEERASKTNFAYEQGRKKADRLLNHVRDNILYYMREIWNAEDWGQRYLRLRSILYPEVELIAVLMDADGNPTSPEFKIKAWRPLPDVVDTNRPLGYLGNYTVYRLMRDDNAMVNWMAQTFLKAGAKDERSVSDPDPEADPALKLEVKIPSDAVFVEALPGTTPLLERFKLMHRAIDVEKARQEAIKQELENLRRLELIKAGEFGDPEFEKTIIADSAGSLAKLVAGLR